MNFTSKVLAHQSQVPILLSLKPHIVLEAPSLHAYLIHLHHGKLPLSSLALMAADFQHMDHGAFEVQSFDSS